MVDVLRFNPPGHNLEDGFWTRLKERYAERVSFSKGEWIVPADPGDQELIFISSGNVACDVPGRGRITRRLWLGRGDKLQPVAGHGSPRYQAVGSVSAWRISKKRTESSEWQELQQGVGDLVALDTWLLDAVRAFRAVPILSRVTSRQVLALVKLEGMAFTLRRGDKQVLSQEKSPGFFFVARGAAETKQSGKAPPQTGFRDCCRVLPEGALYAGDLEIRAHDETSVIVHLPDRGIERFIRTSVGFRRALRGDCAGASSFPNFVLVVGDDDTPIEEITVLIAESVATNFGEKVAVVRLTREQGKPSSEIRLAGDVREIELGLSTFRFDDPLFSGLHSVFLLVPEELRALETYRDLAALGRRLPAEPSRTESPLTVVFLARTPFADEPNDLLPLRDCRRRRVVLLGGSQADEDPSYPPEATRVRLNLEEIRRMDPVSLVRLPAWMRDSIARIARAVTDRRVGVALSGGGAWSFAHLALLEAMHQERIPIDMVSGASGGSLVAAYYCCRGRQGLQMLRDAAGRIDVAVVAAALCTTRALGWAVDVDLESRRLRDLDVPFYPIVADLDAGAEFVPRRGALRVGDCVRASSTLVPLTSTTRFEGRRCADGVFVNNTGERVLAEEGADLIVASDVVQTPSNAKPGSLLDVLVPPAARIRDATAGAYLLTRSADDRDAFLASCRFHPERLPTTPILFSLAKFNESVARPQAETFVTETLKPLWERLRAP